MGGPRYLPGLAPGQPSAAQVAYSGRAALFVDPTNGSDNSNGLSSGSAFRTAAKLARVLGAFTSSEINVAMTISLLGDLPFSDSFVRPRVGSSGTLLVTGSAGATTLYTGAGGFTASAAADSSAGVNEAQTLTDTGFSGTWSNSGAGGVSLISGTTGRRIRITSGAHAGVICWSLRDLDSQTARCSRPMLGTIAFPMSSIAALSSIAASSADPYVIETLPLISVLDPQGYAAADARNGIWRVVFEGVRFAGVGTSPVSLSWTGRTDSQGILFVGCDMQAMGGYFAAKGCYLNNFFNYPGERLLLKACGVKSTSDGNISFRSHTSIDQGTVFDGVRVTVSSGGVIDWVDGGSFNASGYGLDVLNGSAVRVMGPLYGKSNGTGGAHARTPGSSISISVSTPTITGGSSVELVIGAVPTTWAAVVAAPVTVNGSTVGIET